MSWLQDVLTKTILLAGVELVHRRKLDFIAGPGVTITDEDDDVAKATKLTFTATGALGSQATRTMVANITGSSAVPTAVALDTFGFRNGATESRVAPWATMSLLRADIASLPAGFVARTQGHTTAGDGGGGEFLCLTGAPGTYTHDGGTYIVASGGDGSKALWRDRRGAPVNVAEYGASPSASATINAAAINAAATACRASGAALTGAPGTYSVNAHLDLSAIRIIKFQGCKFSGNLGGTPLATIGAASVLRDAEIWLDVVNPADYSLTAGSCGVRLWGISGSKCTLGARGFRDGLLFDGVTADTEWVGTEFSILRLYNNQSQIHFDLDGGSYAVGVQFRGGNYYLGNNQTLAGCGTVKVTLGGGGGSLLSEIDFYNAEIGIDGGSVLTDHGALVYADVNSVWNINAIKFHDARLEHYSAPVAYKFVNINSTTAGRLTVDATFASSATYIPLNMHLGSLKAHAVHLVDAALRTTGGSTNRQQIRPAPYRAHQQGNRIYVPDHIIYDADYSTPVPYITSGVSTRLSRANGDGFLVVSATDVAIGRRYKKSLGAGYPCQLRLSDTAQIIVICYDASGAVLSGTSPYYCNMTSSDSQSYTGAVVYRGLTDWIFIHPDVVEFFIGQANWAGTDQMRPLNFSVDFGPPLIEVPRGRTPENAYVAAGTIQSYYPVGKAFDGESSNGWRNTFDLSTFADAAAVATDTTITLDDVTGITSGDRIGIELDTVLINSERQWHHTTVNGAPSGSVVTLTDALPAGVAIGRQVRLNRWVTR